MPIHRAYFPSCYCKDKAEQFFLQIELLRNLKESKALS